MIYIDCSEVVRNPHLHTGIQRVVRNIAGRLNNTPECQAVAFMGFGFVKVKEIPNSLGPAARESQERRARMTWVLELKRLVSKLPLFKSIFRKLIVPIVEVFRGVYREVVYFITRHSCKQDLAEMRVGDIFVLLDSNWHNDSLGCIRKINKKGVKIITVVYDLIPINYPQYCDEYLQVVFSRWLRQVVDFSNGILTISSDAHRSILYYLETEKIIRRIETNFFYLGADLNVLTMGSNSCESGRLAIFENKKIILSVGTIEPRKRHDLIVEGFRASGLVDKDYVLVCIGKNGWKVDQFLEDCRAADDYFKSIYILHDVADRDLDWFYDSCEVLVFASDIEGFGLPLVEARMKGKKVIASDIPVFREIADRGVYFFKAGDGLSLAECLVNVLTIQDEPGPLKWLTWDDASQQFLSKIKAMDRLFMQKDYQ